MRQWRCVLFTDKSVFFCQLVDVALTNMVWKASPMFKLSRVIHLEVGVLWSGEAFLMV